MSQELYKRYRPKMLKHVFGQEKAISQIREWLDEKKTPHAILLQGPSGCGKTTVARILATKLNCNADGLDYHEINAASSRGIDEIRSIESKMRWESLADGGSKVWVVDEAHKLTSDAQNGFLKPLEDTPDHVYFMIASSVPGKLLETVRNRCTPLSFNLLEPEDIEKTVFRVLKEEKKNISDIVMSCIVELASGSARKSLVLLQQIIDLPDEVQQIERLKAVSIDNSGIELCRLLMKKEVTWKEVASLLRKLKEDPEELRRSILGYAATCTLGGSSRGNLILSLFRDHFFDCGKPGLINACFELVHSQRR